MRKQFAFIVGGSLIVAITLWGAQTLGYMDWQTRTTPGNPASGFMRTWANSSNNFGCLTSAGATCTVDPQATSSAFGVVKPDNSTITISGGVISSVASGGGAVTRISQQVLGSAAPSVTFSSIPGTYTNLLLTYTTRGSNASVTISGVLTINNDTSADYNQQTFFANNSTSPSNGFGITSIGTGNIAGGNATANYSGSGEIKIFDYTNTTFFKNILSQTLTTNNTTVGSAQYQQVNGQWKNTGAITRLDFAASAGNFVTGSVFTLWGIL